MMSDLQDALDKWQPTDFASRLVDAQMGWDIIIEAARQVANPVATDRFCATHWSQMKTDDQCHAVFWDQYMNPHMPCEPFEGALINLGITEDE